MKKYLSLLLFIIFLFCKQALSVVAFPDLIECNQSDGVSLKIFLKGDEFLHWAESIDGYTLMVSSNGIYEYAELDFSGDLIPSGIKANDIGKRTSAENSFLNKTLKGLTFSESQLKILYQFQQIKKSEQQKNAFPSTGSRKLICILMGFSDLAFTKTQSDFNNLFNQINYSTDGAKGSVKDFYLENSYGQLEITTTIAGPYTASNAMAYYGNNVNGNAKALVTEAVNLADTDVDFSDFDNDNDGTVDGIYLIFAGYGEEAGASPDAIWSHKSNIPAVNLDSVNIIFYACSPELRGNYGAGITRIGGICHEFGHILGSRDYYDTNSGTGGRYSGTGQWDVMGVGNWNDNGICPAHHTAYTKWYHYGWIAPIELNTSGYFTLKNSEENVGAYYFNSETPGEYWLMENRQKIGFDTAIPGHGMIIYHVDQNRIATCGGFVNATHPQLMYPVSANATGNPPSYGNINSASCPFPGAWNKTAFTDETTPRSFNWAGNPTNKPVTEISENSGEINFAFMGGNNPGNFIASPVSISEIELTWTLKSDTIPVLIAYNQGGVFGTPENGITYSLGNLIPGGGKVIYSGSGILFNHTGLTALSTYYYKAWSVLTGNNYSSGTTANATTMCSEELGFNLSETRIDFGNVFVGAGLTRNLIITNTSCDDTLLVSSIVSSLPSFTVDRTAFSVEPNDTAIIHFTFTPNAATIINAELTISNSFNDTIINLTGVGIAPPVMEVTPESLNGSLTTGETSTRIFTITNNGSTDLNYSLTIEGEYVNQSPQQNEKSTKANIGFYADETRKASNFITDSEKTIFPLQSLSSPGEIITTYNNFPKNYGMVWANGKLYVVNFESELLQVYDTLNQTVTESYSIHAEPFGIAYDGNYLWIGNSGGNVYGYDLSGNLVGSFSCPKVDFNSITFDGTAFIVNSVSDENPTFYRINNTGTILETFISSSGFYAFGTVWAPQHIDGKLWAIDFHTPSINQIELYAGIAVVRNSVNLLDYSMSYALSHDGVNLWFATYYGPLYKLDDGIEEIKWITVTPTYGTLISGYSQDITVSFDATRLNIGNYSTNIIISSNDPITQTKTIQVELNVSGISHIDVKKTTSAIQIDGVEETNWDFVEPVPIGKNYIGESPTVDAYWKAMWCDSGLFVLLNVQDDNHWPAWESGGAIWEYDWTNVFFDVNDTLTDGRGSKDVGTGHYQTYIPFAEDGYDFPVLNSPPSGISLGGSYAYSLTGENYVIEHFFPFENFINIEGETMNKNSFLALDEIGFDVTITDQDEGDSFLRGRKVWQNDGNIDECWNNMDGAGTIRLVEDIQQNYQLNSSISNGSINCFNAFDTIIVAGDGSSVIVENGASAELIAGQSIRFLPGFYAQSGSYVFGHITTDGTFCDGASGSPIVEQPAVKSVENYFVPEKQAIVSGEKSVKIYPNPNNGQFMLELTNIESDALIRIYNTLGVMVYQSTVKSNAKQEINLTTIQKGIYFINVCSGKNLQTSKIIIR